MSGGIHPALLEGARLGAAFREHPELGLEWAHCMVAATRVATCLENLGWRDDEVCRAINDLARAVMSTAPGGAAHE